MDLNKLYSLDLRNISEVKLFGQIIYNAYQEDTKKRNPKDPEDTPLGLDVFDTMIVKCFPKAHAALGTELWANFKVTSTVQQAEDMFKFRLDSGNIYGIPPRTPEDVLSELSTWFYVEKKGTFYAPCGFFYDMKQAAAIAIKLFPGESEQKVKRLLLTLNAIAHVKNALYRPTNPQVFTEEGELCCNLYINPNIIPKKGDVSVFVDHLKWLFPDDWRYLHDWIGYVVQCKTPRVQWGCVLTGKPGIGKTFIGTALSRMLGAKNVFNPTPQTLEDKFNSWSTRHQVSIVNELKIKEHKKEEVYEQLKTLITDEAVSTRRMHADPDNEAITTAFMFIGNERNFMPIDKNERRLCVMHSIREQHDKTRQEYGAIIDLFNHHADYLLYYFQNIPLDKFDPTLPPMTVSKRTLIDGNVRNILRDFVEQTTPAIFTMKQLHDSINAAFSDMEYMSLHFVKNHIGDIICNLSRTRIGDEVKQLMCKVKDFAELTDKTSSEIKDIYLKGLTK